MANPRFPRPRSCFLRSARARRLLAGVGLIALIAAPSLASAQAAEAPDAAVAVVNDAMVPNRPSALAQFTTGIEDREPIDQVTFVPNDVRTVYFFTDLRGLTGHTVTHRWSHGGDTMAEVSFAVRGPRWRVWSSKDLLPDWIGDWTVEVVTEEGKVIAAETFTYAPPEG